MSDRKASGGALQGTCGAARGRDKAGTTPGSTAAGVRGRTQQSVRSSLPVPGLLLLLKAAGIEPLRVVVIKGVCIVAVLKARV